MIISIDAEKGFDQIHIQLIKKIKEIPQKVDIEGISVQFSCSVVSDSL